MSQSKRRSYTDEFKAEAVKLVTDQEYSVAEAARNLGLHVNLLRTWKQKFSTQSDQQERTEDQRMELARLKAENKRLRMERKILKKATAFFANEKNGGSSSSRRTAKNGRSPSCATYGRSPEADFIGGKSVQKASVRSVNVRWLPK